MLTETVIEPTNYKCVYSTYCRLTLHFVLLTRTLGAFGPPVQIWSPYPDFPH